MQLAVGGVRRGHDAVSYLDPARAPVGKTVRLHADAAIKNLLGWADGR